jgi:hypothetical protein
VAPSSYTQYRPSVEGSQTIGTQRPLPVQSHDPLNVTSGPFGAAIPQQRSQSNAADQSKASEDEWQSEYYYAEIPNKPLPKPGKVTETRFKPETSDYQKVPNAAATTEVECVRKGIRGATGYLRHKSAEEDLDEEERTSMASAGKKPSKDNSNEDMVTRCPIRVEHLEKKVSYGIAGYPRKDRDVVAAGLTLKEVCQQHPEQVWGTMLRIFMAEGWTPVDVYQALPEDVKDVIKDRCHNRPQNFLQAAWRRETDKMMMEDDWYVRIRRNKDKGRRKGEPKDSDTSSSQPTKKRKFDHVGETTDAATVNKKQKAVSSSRKQAWEYAEERNRLVQDAMDEGQTPEANLVLLMHRARTALIRSAAKENPSVNDLDFNAQQNHGAQLLAQKIDNFIREAAEDAKFTTLPAHRMDDALTWLMDIETHRIGVVNRRELTDEKLRLVMYQKLFLFLTELDETSKFAKHVAEPQTSTSVSQHVMEPQISTSDSQPVTKKTKRQISSSTLLPRSLAELDGGHSLTQNVTVTAGESTLVPTRAAQQGSAVGTHRYSHASDSARYTSTDAVNQMHSDAGLDFDIALKEFEEDGTRYGANAEADLALPKTASMNFSTGFEYAGHPAVAGSAIESEFNSGFGVNPYPSIAVPNFYSTSYAHFSMTYAGGLYDNGLNNTPLPPQETQFLDADPSLWNAHSSSLRPSSSEWDLEWSNNTPTTPSLAHNSTASDESDTPSTATG